MIIGQSYQYICPQKTGTATMRAWLIEHYGGKPTDKYHDFRNIDAEFKFMTVRNPYDRMRSLWQFRNYKGTEKGAFAEMCERYASLGLSLSDIADRTGCGNFIRLETLDYGVQKLPFYDPDKPLPGYARKTPGKTVKLADEGRAVVLELFEDDFERFGYEK
jgi:hypothetical protein